MDIELLPDACTNAGENEIQEALSYRMVGQLKSYLMERNGRQRKTM